MSGSTPGRTPPWHPRRSGPGGRAGRTPRRSSAGRRSKSRSRPSRPSPAGTAAGGRTARRPCSRRPTGCARPSHRRRRSGGAGTGEGTEFASNNLSFRRPRHCERSEAISRAPGRETRQSQLEIAAVAPLPRNDGGKTSPHFHLAFPSRELRFGDRDKERSFYPARRGGCRTIGGSPWTIRIAPRSPST